MLISFEGIYGMENLAKIMKAIVEGSGAHCVECKLTDYVTTESGKYAPNMEKFMVTFEGDHSQCMKAKKILENGIDH